VRLGCIGTSARWLVPPVLEAVTAKHPKVRVVVVDATTTSLVPRLLADELDLAVVNLPVSHPDVSTEPLFDEDRLLIVPDGHPLADRDRVRLAELADHPLLLEPAGTAFRDATLAFQGFGAAIVPATAAPDWLAGSWHRVAVDGLARRSVGLARRSRGLLPAPARALRERVIEVVAAQGPGTEGVHPAT
jgi:DNA-binding transcriptional LysR family regulator